MGLGLTAPSADIYLRDKIRSAITQVIIPLIDDSQPPPTVGTSALANAINKQPEPIYERLFFKLKDVDDLNVESPDAALTAAVTNADSLDLMYQFYGISPV